MQSSAGAEDEGEVRSATKPIVGSRTVPVVAAVYLLALALWLGGLVVILGTHVAVLPEWRRHAVVSKPAAQEVPSAVA